MCFQTVNQIHLKFVNALSKPVLHVYTLDGKIVALLLEAWKEDIMLYCQEAFTVCHISARDVYRRVIIISWHPANVSKNR